MHGRGRGTPPFLCPPSPTRLRLGHMNQGACTNPDVSPCLCTGATPEWGCRRGKGPLPPSVRKGGHEPKAAQAPPSPVLPVKGALLSTPPPWPTPLPLDIAVFHKAF